MNREKFFGDAYEKGFRRTVAFLRRRGANLDLAEDLAQTAWVRGWEHLSTLRVDQHIQAWVNSIAYNLLRDHLRDHSLQIRRMRHLTSVTGDPKISPLVNEAVIDLHNALRRIPKRQRNVLETVYLQAGDVQTPVIANDQQAAAYHSCLSRARKALRKAMDAA
jgi:RNA polymerase sigma factor (sigma-70 family)